MPRVHLRLAVLPVLAGLFLPGMALAAGSGWQLCQGGGAARATCSVSCNGESRRQSCGTGEMCECQCAPRPQCRCRAMEQETRSPGAPGGRLAPAGPAGLSRQG